MRLRLKLAPAPKTAFWSSAHFAPHRWGDGKFFKKLSGLFDRYFISLVSLYPEQLKERQALAYAQTGTVENCQVTPVSELDDHASG